MIFPFGVGGLLCVLFWDEVAIIYYSVAGGPFGTEDVITAAGGGLVLGSIAGNGG
jgi:hypothetical protein